ECGLQYGGIDLNQLRGHLVGRDGWQVDEGCDAAIGEPGNAVDEVFILIDGVIARRLHLVDAPQCEGRGEVDNGLGRACRHVHVLAKQKSVLLRCSRNSIEIESCRHIRLAFDDPPKPVRQRAEMVKTSVLPSRWQHLVMHSHIVNLDREWRVEVWTPREAKSGQMSDSVL